MSEPKIRATVCSDSLGSAPDVTRTYQYYIEFIKFIKIFLQWNRDSVNTA